MSWRLAPVVAAVLATGAIAAGCGDDDEDNGDGTVISVPSVSVPEGVSVSVPTAVTIPTNAEDARNQAYEACINGIQNVPEAQRDQARQGCEQIK